MDEILAHPALGARPFRWVMRWLALALAPVEENDPAALAFAGLPPDTELPLDREPPGETETGAINSLAARIVEHLSALIDQRVEWGRPGGIDRIRLPPERGDCRRSRLDRRQVFAGRSDDRNPARRTRSRSRLQPWLGVVVRFIYE